MNKRVETPRVYRSVFLANAWAHQKYLSWTVVNDLPGLRILKKRYGIFDRYLLLLTAPGTAGLEDAVARAMGPVGLSDVIIHDFDSVYSEAPRLARHVFRRAKDSERLLNVATFVIDLLQEESAIFAGMSSECRRRIRRAQEAGVIVEAHPCPAPELRNAFSSALSSFAVDYGLKLVDAAAIDRMYDSGDAILYVARNKGIVTNYLFVYTAGGIGYTMYGLNLMKGNNGEGYSLGCRRGANRYVHWEAMRHLKAAGMEWFDIGGLSSLDRTERIHSYKEQFGGTLVDLGTEWRCMGAITKSAVSAAGVFARLRRQTPEPASLEA
jgi:hypothetical protein